MFADGTYLIDAGWLFLTVWSLALLTFFLIVFAEDLPFPFHRGGNDSREKGPGPLRSASSREH